MHILECYYQEMWVSTKLIALCDDDITYLII